MKVLMPRWRGVKAKATSYDTQIIIIMMHKLCCMRAESRTIDHDLKALALTFYFCIYAV